MSSLVSNMLLTPAVIFLRTSLIAKPCLAACKDPPTLFEKSTIAK